jgi:parvulin-like peptidyl-prolyl isomerase
MKKAGILILALVAVLLVAAACENPLPTATPPSERVVTAQPTHDNSTVTPQPTATATIEPQAALVNGQAITVAEYERQIARYEASLVAAGQDLISDEGKQALEQGRTWVLDMMIEQILIEQAAAKEGVSVSDEELDKTISDLYQEIGQDAFNSWLESEGMTLEEMRERLRSDMISTQMANRVAESIPTTADHVRAYHILVNTADEAQRILDQLNAGTDFETLARTYSQDISTRDIGGDLGYFPQGVLISPEVEAAAFALEAGQISGIVQSSLGYHIVKVIERIASYEISAENQRLLRDTAVRQWLDNLRTSSDIQIFVTSLPTP